MPASPRYGSAFAQTPTAPNVAMSSPLRRSWLVALFAVISFPASAATAPAKPTTSEWLFEELTFESKGVSLAGTLVLPAAREPVASVVLVHGAHPGDRMVPFAQLLARQRFAVLTYDRRGIGRSGGDDPPDNASQARLELLARDAAAALEVLKGDSRLRRLPAGYVGLSHAGWVVPIAAGWSPRPDFVALSSGPVCTVSEDLHFSALSEKDPNAIANYSAAQWAEYMKSTPYRSDDVDPRTKLVSLTVPALWMFGGRDDSIPVGLSVERIEELIRGGRENFQYRVFPEEGHNLLDSPQQESFRYLVEWLLGNVTTPGEEEK
jgi:uncharacterized protein